MSLWSIVFGCLSGCSVACWLLVALLSYRSYHFHFGAISNIHFARQFIRNISVGGFENEFING